MGDDPHIVVGAAELRQQLLHVRTELDAERAAATEFRRRVTHGDKEKLTLVSNHNEEMASLRHRAAAAEAALENCNAAKCETECELLAAVKRVAGLAKTIEDKEASHAEERESFRSQVEDLRRRLSKSEDEGAKFTFAAEKKESALSGAILAKEQELDRVRKELELTQIAKSELEKLSDTREKQIVELERKAAELDSELGRRTDEAKLQRSESDWMLQKEKQTKQELEALVEKAKGLEANVESERAAHLETKFNSEIVQLRLRDVEAALEDAKASSASKDAALADLRAKLDAAGDSLREEKKSGFKSTNRLKATSAELADAQRHVSQQEQLVDELSKEIDAHQKHFAVLKEELEKTKANQRRLEGNYSTWLKDLEITVYNYWHTLKQRQFHEDYPPSPPSSSSPSPKSLVEGLKVLLGEYLVHLQDSKASSENMFRKDSKITELQQTLGRLEYELEQRSRKIVEAAAEADRRVDEREALAASLEAERAERARIEGDNGDILEARRVADEEKVAFLGATLAKLSAMIPNSTSLSDFNDEAPEAGRLLESVATVDKSWNRLTAVTTEYVAKLGLVLKALKKKARVCEDEMRNAEEGRKQMAEAQEETLHQMAEAAAAVEVKALEEKRQLEDHFGEALQKVHDRAKLSNAEAQDALDRLRTAEASLQKCSAEIRLLKSESNRLLTDRTSLTAACALLAGVLLSQTTRRCVESRHRLAEEMNAQATTFRRHCIVLVETLSSEFPSGDEDETLPKIRRGFGALLAFRRAAIVIIAANRFVHLGRTSRASADSVVVVDGFPRKGRRTMMMIGRGEAGPSWRMSKKERGVGTEPSLRLNEWLTSTDLQSGVVLALEPLMERLEAKEAVTEMRNIVGPSCIKLLDRIKAHFPEEEKGFSFGEASDRSGNLCWRLGHGLTRALAATPLRPRLRLSSAAQIAASLQHHLLAITHRLHSAEIDRKDLKRENALLAAKVGDFKGVQEMASTFKNQTSQLQQELQGSVKAEQFASVCGELQATLAREQQTQKLLEHQARRIQNLSQRVEMSTKQLEERDGSLRQLSSQISELKKDSRRKEIETREKAKSLDRLAEERRALLSNVADAEKTLTTVSKDKERLHAFLESTEKSLQQVTKHLRLLTDSDVADASVLPINLAKLVTSGSPHSPADSPNRSSGSESSELRAVRHLVSLFVDVYQASFAKMASLQRELTANAQHLRRLKAELSDACARGGVAEDFVPRPKSMEEDSITTESYRRRVFKPLANEDSENSNSMERILENGLKPKLYYS